ncbi:MAG: amidohydrolase family protein [Acidobacteria bacterium]|nr:amidohydrolase family protein [Acidobacteriota bacterium]
MRRAIHLFCLLTILGCTAGDVPPSPATTTTESRSRALAIVDVDVVPMDGTERVLEDHDILVEDDRIIAVGPDLEVPAGATVIDGRGLHVVPGLAEMHGHIPPPTTSRQDIEDTLFLYLAGGITTVRGMLGAPGQLDLREQSLSGEILSPTLYLAGPSFNGQSVSSPEQARQMVRNQVEEGWDLLKVHPGLTRGEYDAMAETANELGIRFGGHVPQEVGLLHALEMNQETFDHMDGYVAALDAQAGPVDPGRLAELVRQTKNAKAWIVPTMALWETLYGTADLDTLQSYDELRYVPPAQIEVWTEAFRNRLQSPQYDAAVARRHIENRTVILRALHEGGVPILMGTDAPQQFSVPGFSLHHELDRMAAADMSSYEIIKSGTSNVGRYFANEDTFGSIAPGHRADLLLLSRNPLENHQNLSSLEGVMVRGLWIPRSEIDERLSDIERRAKAQ